MGQRYKQVRLVLVVMACRIIVSAPVPVLFKDFGLQTLDLDLGLGFGLRLDNNSYGTFSIHLRLKFLFFGLYDFLCLNKYVRLRTTTTTLDLNSINFFTSYH